MSWDMLKATGKLLGFLAADCAKNILGPIVEPHVEKKVAQKLKPNLRKMPLEMQYRDGVKLGMSEKELGDHLGLPDTIEFDKKTEYWYYERRKTLSSEYFECRVRLMNQQVIYFRMTYADKNGCLRFENPPLVWLNSYKPHYKDDPKAVIERTRIYVKE